MQRAIDVAIGRGLVDAIEIVPGGYMLFRTYARLRERLAHFAVPYSFHFVDGSLASADFPSNSPIEAMKALVAEFEPVHVSDHLTCCRLGDVDLEMNLPILMTEESLAVCVENVRALKDALPGRCPLLVEHVPQYFRFRGSTLTPAEFLTEVARRSECGILLDLHNLYCDERNCGLDGEAFISNLPSESIKEIHLAGGRELPEDGMYMDTHDNEIPARVFELLDFVLARAEPSLIVIERENRIRGFDRVLGDLEQVRARVGGR